MYFVLLEEKPKEEPLWWEIDFANSRLKIEWTTALGIPQSTDDRGEFYKEVRKNPEKYTIVKAESRDALKKTSEWKTAYNRYVKSYILKDSKIGWLTPGGEFIGCEYSDHGEIADLVFHQSERKLEESGYAKFYESPSINSRINVWMKPGLSFNDMQKETIKRLGLYENVTVLNMMMYGFNPKEV